MSSSRRKNSSETSVTPQSVNSSSNNNNSPHNSQQNLRRAVRQLRRSGRRLVLRDDGWAVLHCGSPVVRLTPEEVAYLAAEGHVVEAQGGGYVVASATTEEATSAPDALVTGVWVFAAAGCPVAPVSGRGFERLARKARSGQGPLTLRQAEAGLRLIIDAEAAARTPGLTMDWSNTVTDRQRRRGRDGGLTFTARTAARRLETITNTIGAAPFALAWRACVERRSLSKLAAELDITFRVAASRLSTVLEDIADAYDGCC
jgi:hypothetical protein